MRRARPSPGKLSASIATYAAGRWVLGSPLLDDDDIRRDTPQWLAQRGVFVSERDVVTA